MAISRSIALGGAALLLLGGASPVARLDVAVEKLRSSKGVLRVCLTANPQSFPRCIDDAFAVRQNLPATVSAIHFEGLPAGSYAVAVVHDENGNRKLDTLMGIPREGFGFSRNPAIGFGPPRFAAARFALEAGANAQDIRMRYLL